MAQTGFRLPNVDLDLPERDRPLEPEDFLRRFVDVGEQVEENFKAIMVSPQFARGAPSGYLAAQSADTASGAFGANIIYTNASITLPFGTWIVRAFASAFTSDAIDALSVGVYNQTTAAEVAAGRGASANPSAINFRASLSTEILMTVEADTQVCPLICRNGSSTLGASSAAGGIVGRITATRR